MIRSTHGNPTVLLLPPENIPANRIVVSLYPLNEPIWISHSLLTIEDAVRVDVWHGEFENHLSGGCILPEGEYVAFLELVDGSQRQIETFRVVKQVLFDGHFLDEKSSWFHSQVQWHQDGQWKSEKNGIYCQGGHSYLFVEGEMHGCLEGVFQLEKSHTSEQTWGLISRHYNAFHHLRLLFTSKQDELTLRLVRKSTDPSHREEFSVIAETSYPLHFGTPYRVAWLLNGKRHDILVNGHPVLEAQDAYMGGVTVVGLFSESEGVLWNGFSMHTTQPVPMGEIIQKQYYAKIRPGNIHQLRLLESGNPDQNICWESGIQFGHIGGSEIKFSQGAKLTTTYKGALLTQFRWEGPMPKFVERSDDVRGQAHGIASFFPDRIVLADYVLTWVKRSMGPDFDLLGRLMNGPARVAFQDSDTFQEWSFPADGTIVSLGSKLCSQIYPVAILFPILLGKEQWWLKAVVGNLLHLDDQRSASIFGWQCPHGLTASHDFRVAPTEPGIEYGFSMVICWQRSDKVEEVEADLQNLREDWYHPVEIEPVIGSLLTYSGEKEKPAEAIGFDGCFNRAQGIYHTTAQNGLLSLRLEPGKIQRRSITFLIREFPSDVPAQCILDNRELEPGVDYADQALHHTTRLVSIMKRIDKPVHLKINPKQT
ncbi:MAG: hypothetical protein WC975_12235 [Phycisphaerae bacterium]